MFKFIHAADIHLDSPLHKLADYEGAPGEALRHATRRAFRNLVQTAVEEDVDFVLIAGDLYDGDWKDYNTGLYLISQLRKLREAGIAVFMVAGNHDAASRITRTLRLPKGVTVFPSNKAATVQMEDLGVAIHGRSFSSAVMKKNLAERFPAAIPGFFNIGLLHTSLNGREGHEPYAPCSLDDLCARGYDYWALGHAHQREIVLEDPFVVFSGNIQGRHIREPGPKGCMIVAVDERGGVNMDFKPLDVVRWAMLDIDASGADDGYAVIDRADQELHRMMAENDGRPLIVRVIIGGHTAAHAEMAGSMERWINEFRGMAMDASGGDACIEKVKIETSYPPEADAITTREGPIGELNRCLSRLESDPDRLMALGGTLDDLVKKLPRELGEDPDGIRSDDPAWIRDMIRQVRPLLMQRLMKRGAGG